MIWRKENRWNLNSRNLLEDPSDLFNTKIHHQPNLITLQTSCEQTRCSKSPFTSRTIPQGTWILFLFHCDVPIATPGKTWRASQSFSDTLIVEVDNNQKLENQFASSTNAGGISSVQRLTLRSCSTGPVLIEGMEHHLATSTKWAPDPVIHGLMGPRIHG